MYLIYPLHTNDQFIDCVTNFFLSWYWICLPQAAFKGEMFIYSCGPLCGIWQIRWQQGTPSGPACLWFWGLAILSVNPMLFKSFLMLYLHVSVSRPLLMMALKDAVPDFNSLFTVLWTVSNTFAQVARVQSCANHMQHIEHLPHATCVPCGTKGQLSYQVDRVKIAL